MKRFIAIVIVLMIFGGCCHAENAAAPNGISIDPSGFSVGRDELFKSILGSFASGHKKQDTAHAGVVAKLRGMGIDVPDEAVEKTEARMDSFRKAWQEEGFDYRESPRDFAVNLLWDLGSGEYDHDSALRTPTSSDVYAFDTEVCDIDNMYRLFLQGVSAIVPGFEPAGIEETIEEYPDLIAMFGIYGKTTVSFVLNGTGYEHELRFMGDWFDENAIGWINEVLEKEGFEHRLYAFGAMDQGLILVYGDDTLAQKMRSLISQPLM